jgi:hypothetical protein
VTRATSGTIIYAWTRDDATATSERITAHEREIPVYAPGMIGKGGSSKPRFFASRIDRRMRQPFRCSVVTGAVNETHIRRKSLNR